MTTAIPDKTKVCTNRIITYKKIYHMNKASYQPDSINNEIQLLYYLQQHEITENHFTNFTQKSKTADSYLISG